MYLRGLTIRTVRRILWRYSSSDSTKEPPLKAVKKNTNQRSDMQKFYKMVRIDGSFAGAPCLSTVGGGSASMVQRRVAKLDPALWPGVHAATATAPAAPPDPLSEAVLKSAVLAAPPDTLSEEAALEEAGALAGAHNTPLGCFEPAVAEVEDVEDEVSPPGTAKGNKGKSNKARAAARERAFAAKQKEMQRAGKQASFLSSLLCYMEVCVNSGLVNRAQNTLLYYRNLSRNFSRLTDVRDVRLYNTLLVGFARKGQLDRVSSVLNIMREDEVAPDAESYALMLQCVGRQPRTPDSVAFAKRVLRDMDEAGVALGDAARSVVSDARRALAIKALSWADPGRARSWPVRLVHYNCPLVDHLNTDMDTHQVEPPALGVKMGRSYQELAKEQLANEMAGTFTVASVYRPPAEEEVHTNTEENRALMLRMETDWQRRLTEAFQLRLAPVRQQFHGNNISRCISLYPYLTGMDVAEYVQLMMAEIRSHLAGSSELWLGRGWLHRRLGELAMKRYQSSVKKSSGQVDRIMAVYGQYLKWYVDQTAPGYLPRLRWNKIVAEQHSDAESEYAERGWSPVIISSIGQFLYKLILHDVKIHPSITKLARLTEQPIPAFYTVYRQEGARHREVVRPHPALARLYSATRRQHITFDTSLVPMVSPPVPWVSATTGGYLMSSSPLMRIRVSGQTSSQLQRLNETPTQQLFPVLDSLNQLGAVPWIINTQVLDIAIHVFNNNGCDQLDIPSPVSQLPALPPLQSDLSADEKRKLKRLRVQMARRKAEQFSLWCDAHYKLSLANHFRDRVLWLPHTVDFRGRAYPCPPHLSHLGSDLSRSMLKFARGKPLGPAGLDWLKVHLINLTGLKKREPTSKRLEYCNEILDDIFESADHPLTGSGWWRTSEEPWQTLAACQELVAALRSPEPATFVSHLPIHQDGSCNGLQHYAALGRDADGAASVNLTPADRPQDVYSDVAVLVERQRQKDAADGLPIAIALDGYVYRKVIKQTVMTTVYGVTRYGARLQIAKQLNSIADFPPEHRYQGSHYLVTRTFLSLQQMFTSAKEIQDWLTECARVVSALGEPMQWVTPLGLPVLQSYFRNSHKSTTKPLGDTGRMSAPHFYIEAFDRPNAMKQRNAFPPNYIHSLDSAHMMLTSLHCQRAGLTFVSVHDCYWTHASSVDTMNKVCREQFVALHSRPLLVELADGLLTQFGSPAESADDEPARPTSRARVKAVLPAVPARGHFRLEQVLNSVYFFS